MSTNKDRIFDDSISIFLYIYIENTQEKYFFYDSKTKLTKQYYPPPTPTRVREERERGERGETVI